MDRRDFISGCLGCCLSLALTGCTSTPVTNRKQLSIYPDSVINKQAALMYKRMIQRSKLSNDKDQLKTIIDKCGDSFHVVIIDQKSITNLIPGWNIDLSKLSRPLKEKYINLAKLKILKNFGGLFVPPSFICKRDLFETYYENCSK